MTEFHGDENKNNFIFRKKNQNDLIEKTEFFKTTNSQYFVNGLILGLLQLIDANFFQFLWPHLNEN